MNATAFDLAGPLPVPALASMTVRPTGKGPARSKAVAFIVEPAWPRRH